MAALAQQIILHPYATNTLQVWSTTLGRDKTFRSVQYLARFLAWHAAARGWSKDLVAQLTALKTTLGTSRKLLRAGKWLEHLQALVKASAQTDPILRVTSMGRQLGYAVFLFTDTLIWAHTTKVKPFKLTTYQRIVKESMRFWVIGIGFSIISGVYSRQALSAKLNKAKLTASSPEKEAESRAELTSLKAKYDDVNYQLIQDLLDIWIPATNYGLVNFSEGTLGLFGFITSLMGLNSQVQKVLYKPKSA